MRQNQTYNPHRIKQGLTIKIAPSDQDISTQGNTSYKSESGEVQNKNFMENSEKQTYLSIKVIRQMLTRLLSEKKIPQKMLAQRLNITVKELDNLFLQEDIALNLIPIVNLPLINLYCKTKFDNDKKFYFT